MGRILLPLLLLPLTTVPFIHARQAAAPQALDAAARAQIIDGAIDHMRRAYIFEDVAEKMAAAVKTRAANKEYDTLTEPKAFAETLTHHLQEVSKDKHLRIIYNPDGLPQRGGPPTAEDRANTDALIFDLRRNGGGSPVTIGILSSYLFDKVTHLNDFYVRERDQRQQFFTTAEVEGRRYGTGKPVYVLTSNRTFSAAEEFTYNLKNLKRATIVGETSGGGAHPGGVRRITDHVGIWLPNGRAINPITKTNWEGTGVEPDIKTSAGDALAAAHLDALKKIRSSATDPRHQQQLDAAITALTSKQTTTR